MTIKEEKMLIPFLPSSDVKNKVFVSLPKPCLFLAATDISYVVYGVRLFNVYLLTLFVMMFRVREPSFFSLILNLVRVPFPVLTGSIQDISALLDVMLVMVRFVGSSGTRARENEWIFKHTIVRWYII